MLIYHTYSKSNGFDLNKLDFNRGIFCIKPWWMGKPGYENHSAFSPNEFGDTVVELDVEDVVKTYTSAEQINVLEDLFDKNNPKIKSIIDKYDMGNFDREDWHKLDGIIGTKLKRQGYKMIHYTDDQMYGDTWAILDPKIIRGMKHK